jgi:hypothetical protein
MTVWLAEQKLPDPTRRGVKTGVVGWEEDAERDPEVWWWWKGWDSGGGASAAAALPDATSDMTATTVGRDFMFFCVVFCLVRAWIFVYALVVVLRLVSTRRIQIYEGGKCRNPQ